MAMNRLECGLLAALWMLTFVVSPAAAQSALQEDLGVGMRRPWAQGVLGEDQRVAEALFMEGNQLYKDSLFLKAAEKYREALTHWDHPGIHYNLAKTLRNQGQQLELHKHLTKAMLHGEQPLDREKYQDARFVKTVVEQQLTYLDISSEVAGATVRLNGQVLFVGPGSFKEWVLPGTYEIVATKEGYPPNQRLRATKGGDKIALHIRQLYTDEDLSRHTRPWSAWKPWAVLSTGVVLAAGGGVLHLRARDSYRDFDVRAAACGPVGCEPGLGPVGLRTRGENLQKAAWGGYAVGGAMFATGAVLAFINRTHSYRVSPDEHEQSLGIALQLNEGSSGVIATLRF